MATSDRARGAANPDTGRLPPEPFGGSDLPLGPNGDVLTLLAVCWHWTARRPTGKINGVMYRFCGSCGTKFVDQSWPRLCTACGQYTFRGPKPLVKAVVPVAGGRLMVARRDVEPGRGGLELPGGYIEFGETWQEAMVRELQEETGLVFEAGQVVLHSVRSVGEFVTVFGLLPAIVELPTQRTEEVSEFLAVDGPVQMAFPSHHELVAAYFAT